MKNLKKISRAELKKIDGGKLPIGLGNCGDACGPNDGFCEQFGLTCGVHVISNSDSGQITSYCRKCL